MKHSDFKNELNFINKLLSEKKSKEADAKVHELRQRLSAELNIELSKKAIGQAINWEAVGKIRWKLLRIEDYRLTFFRQEFRIAKEQLSKSLHTLTDPRAPIESFLRVTEYSTKTYELGLNFATEFLAKKKYTSAAVSLWQLKNFLSEVSRILPADEVVKSQLLEVKKYYLLAVAKVLNLAKELWSKGEYETAIADLTHLNKILSHELKVSTDDEVTSAQLSEVKGYLLEAFKLDLYRIQEFLAEDQYVIAAAGLIHLKKMLSNQLKNPASDEVVSSQLLEVNQYITKTFHQGLNHIEELLAKGENLIASDLLLLLQFHFAEELKTLLAMDATNEQIIKIKNCLQQSFVQEIEQVKELLAEDKHATAATKLSVIKNHLIAELKVSPSKELNKQLLQVKIYLLKAFEIDNEKGNVKEKCQYIDDIFNEAAPFEQNYEDAYEYTQAAIYAINVLNNTIPEKLQKVVSPEARIQKILNNFSQRINSLLPQNEDTNRVKAQLLYQLHQGLVENAPDLVTEAITILSQAIEALKSVEPKLAEDYRALATMYRALAESQKAMVEQYEDEMNDHDNAAIDGYLETAQHYYKWMQKMESRGERDRAKTLFPKLITAVLEAKSAPLEMNKEQEQRLCYIEKDIIVKLEFYSKTISKILELSTELTTDPQEIRHRESLVALISKTLIVEPKELYRICRKPQSNLTDKPIVKLLKAIYEDIKCIEHYRTNGVKPEQPQTTKLLSCSR